MPRRTFETTLNLQLDGVSIFETDCEVEVRIDGTDASWSVRAFRFSDGQRGRSVVKGDTPFETLLAALNVEHIDQQVNAQFLWKQDRDTGFFHPTGELT